MREVHRALLTSGYLVLPLWIFAEQMGLPIPSIPILLAAGALAADGTGNLWLMAALAATAALTADLAWFSLGRRYGSSALNRLCRVSLEPDSCVRRTKNLIGKYGLRLLLFSKFVPGLNALAAPSAGVARSPWRRFLLADVAGILIWILSLEWMGYIFARQLAKLVQIASGAGSALLLLAVAGAVAGYIVMKYLRRRRFLAELRTLRITPDELKRKLDEQEPVTIIDLRHSLDFLPEPYTIPGAIRIPMEDMDRRHAEIPRDSEVVLYCTCPNEASSATMAKRLKQLGVPRVRPLQGGLRAWRVSGFPLESEFGPVPPIKRGAAPRVA